MDNIQDFKVKYYTNTELNCIDCNFKISPCKQPKDIIIAIDNGNPDAENVKQTVIGFINAVKHNAASIMLCAYNFYVRVKFFTAGEIRTLDKSGQLDTVIEQTLDSFLKYDAKISFEQLINNLNVTFANKPDADLALVLVNASTDTNDLSTVIKPFTKLAASMANYNAEIHTIGITTTHDNLMLAKFNSISSSINTYQSIKSYTELPDALNYVAGKINHVWSTVVLKSGAITYFAKNFITTTDVLYEMANETKLVQAVNCKFFIKWDRDAKYEVAVRLNGQVYKADIEVLKTDYKETAVFKTQAKIELAHFILGFIFDNVFNDIDQLKCFGDNIKFALDMSASAINDLQKITSSQDYIKCYYLLVQQEAIINSLEQWRQVQISTKSTPVEAICSLFECYTNNLPVNLSAGAQFLHIMLNNLPTIDLEASGLILQIKQLESIDSKYYSCVGVHAQRQTVREYINKLFTKDPTEQSLLVLLPSQNSHLERIKAFASAQLSVFYNIDVANTQVEFNNIIFSALSVAVDNLFDNKNPDHSKQISNYEHIAELCNRVYQDDLDANSVKPKIKIENLEKTPKPNPDPNRAMLGLSFTQRIEHIYNAYLSGDNIRVRLPYYTPSNRIFLAQVLTGIKLKHLRAFIDNLHSLEFHMIVLEEEHRRLLKNSKTIFALSGANLRKYVFDNFDIPVDCLPAKTPAVTNLEKYYKDIFGEITGNKTENKTEENTPDQTEDKITEKIPKELLAKLNSFEDLNLLIKSIKEPKELFADLMPGLDFIRNFFKLTTGCDIEQDEAHRTPWKAMIYQNLFHAKSKTRKRAIELSSKFSNDSANNNLSNDSATSTTEVAVNKSGVVNYTELYYDFISAKGGFNSFDYFQNLFLLFIEDMIIEDQAQVKTNLKNNLGAFDDIIKLWLTTDSIKVAVGILSNELYGGRIMKFVTAMQKNTVTLFKDKMHVLLTGKYYDLNGRSFTVIKDFSKFIKGSKINTQWAMSEENIYCLWKQNRDALNLEEWQNLFGAKLPKIAKQYELRK